MEGDQTIGAEIAADAGLEITTSDWIIEGGALDCDGTGLVATTEQVLLNPNRNPHLSRADQEMRLKRDLGFDRVLWLGDGLINDHTDGHVDNLARFVATMCWRCPWRRARMIPMPRSMPMPRRGPRRRA
jgi:agmatine deiminase